MRIAQDLSMSQVRKAGKSLTVRSAARFTRGRSGRTRLGLDRRHESERGHSLSLGAGERLAPAALKADWMANACQADPIPGRRTRSRVWRMAGGECHMMTGLCEVNLGGCDEDESSEPMPALTLGQGVEQNFQHVIRNSTNDKIGILSHEGNGHGNPTWRHEHAKKSARTKPIEIVR